MTSISQARRPVVIGVIDSLAETGGAERRLVEDVLALGGRFEHRVVRLDDCLEPTPECEARVAAGVEVAAEHDPAVIADRLAGLLHRAAAGSGGVAPRK